jgi:hypothetical protein
VTLYLLFFSGESESHLVTERIFFFLAQMILEKFNRISFCDPFNLNKAVNERDESPIEGFSSLRSMALLLYSISDGLLFHIIYSRRFFNHSESSYHGLRLSAAVENFSKFFFMKNDDEFFKCCQEFK